MESLELTPSGTSTNEGKRDLEITKSGASVLREATDLFKHWTGQAIPQVDGEAKITHIEDAPSIDSQILFGLIRDPRVRLIRPILIEIRREGDSSIAFWAEAEEFGQGGDRSAAIEDFGRTISQLFVSLSRQESELGPDLKRMLGLLRSHMKMRAA